MPAKTSKHTTPAKRTGRPTKQHNDTNAAPLAHLSDLDPRPDATLVANHSQLDFLHDHGEAGNFVGYPDTAPDVQDVDLIRTTLRLIMLDPSAPAAAKAQAARTLAEMAGALGRHAAPPAPPTKPLAEMTREELEAELARETG